MHRINVTLAQPHLLFRILLVRILFLVSFHFIAGSNYAQEQKDTLFFNNGSLVIGKLKKVKLGVVTFDPDDANDITVQLRKLRGITAVKSIYRIETTTNEAHFGRIVPDTIRGRINIVSLLDTVTIYLEDISVVYPYYKSIGERFDGNVGLGYSYTRSSNFGRLNFDGSITYKSRKDELGLTASGIYTVTDSSFSRDREEIFMKANRYFSATWFYTVMLGYQRNLELGLASRFQEGIGVGNKFLTTKSLYSWARTGIVLNQEKNVESVKSGTLAEIFGQMELNFFRFSKPEISLKVVESFYYSLSQNGRFRSDGETTMAWEIFTDFDLNLSFYHNYDSKPPGEDGRKIDIGIIFGLAYSF